MSATQSRPRFIAVEDTEAEPASPVTQTRDDAARKMLITALTALSQRAITAITNLFSLFLVSLVFVLFGRILDDPTPNRLAGVGGFAVFCLLTDIVRRRNK